MFDNAAILALFSDEKQQIVTKNPAMTHKNVTSVTAKTQNVTVSGNNFSYKSYACKNSDVCDASDAKNKHIPEKENFFSHMTPLEAENFAECLAERAAIMEVGGELTPEEAQSRANVICLAEFRRNQKNEVTRK